MTAFEPKADITGTMSKKSRKPFIPKNYPKSWILFISFILLGLGIGLLTFIMSSLELDFIQRIGAILFWGCVIGAMVNLFIFFYGSITGGYRKVEEKEWKEQVW